MPWYPNVLVEVRDEVLDEAVNDLGLTWVHWTVLSGNRSEGRGWEWTNDDADPWHIHWPAEHLTVLVYPHGHDAPR